MIPNLISAKTRCRNIYSKFFYRIKFSKISRKAPVTEFVFFRKDSLDLEFAEKGHHNRYFLEDFGKFLRTVIMQNTYE